MTVTVYRSTDASAPTLSGSAGALAGVLDACLVNGYGSKTAAGWAIAFTGTNLRAYRAASGNRYYLALDDTGTTTARGIGYESMTAVSTGTNPFPTTAQLSAGVWYLKSSAADATARPWIVIATATTFYLFINQANVANSSSWTTGLYHFGDFPSYVTGDVYNTRISGLIGSTNSNTNNRSISAATFASVALTGMWLPRTYNGTGTSIACSTMVDSVVHGRQAAANNPIMLGSTLDLTGAAISALSCQWPDRADNGLRLSRLFVTENANNALRGYLPGLWTMPNLISTNLVVGDTFTGSGDYAGKTFELMRFTNTSALGAVLMETSNTW